MLDKKKIKEIDKLCEKIVSNKKKPSYGRRAGTIAPTSPWVLNTGDVSTSTPFNMPNTDVWQGGTYTVPIQSGNPFNQAVTLSYEHGVTFPNTQRGVAIRHLQNQIRDNQERLSVVRPWATDVSGDIGAVDNTRPDNHLRHIEEHVQMLQQERALIQVQNEINRRVAKRGIIENRNNPDVSDPLSTAMTDLQEAIARMENAEQEAQIRREWEPEIQQHNNLQGNIPHSQTENCPDLNCGCNSRRLG